MPIVLTRATKLEARYKALGGAEHCSACRFYMPQGTCGHIIGPVSPEGWCKYYSREFVQRWQPGSAGGNAAALPPGASLDLSFMTPGTLDPRITFTRASTGTYFDSNGVMRTAAVNQPRWDYDPVTHQLRGLLLEDARTNLWLQSADASNAAWSKSGAPLPVVTANQITAPDGSLTAARVVYGNVISASSFCLLAQTLTGTVAAYTCSVWLRGTVGGEILWIMATVDGVNYYRTQCTLTTAWQRFTLTTPNLTAASWFIQIGVDRRDTGQTPAPPTQTVYVWGGQLELGGFATSYIPTTAAAVTRARDACSVPVANITGYDTTKGSLFIEYNLVGFNMSFPAPAQLVGSNAGTDYISVDEMTTAGGATPSMAGISIVSDVVGGTTLTTGNYGVVGSVTAPAGTIQKGAAAWALSTPMAGAHNGVSTSSATGSATSLPTVANLTIAGGMHFQNQLSLWARRVVYWPRVLTNAEMQQVTT